MAENLLHDYHDYLPEGVTLVPGADGIFDVTLGDHRLFSKSEAGRFPEENEVEGKLGELLGVE